MTRDIDRRLASLEARRRSANAGQRYLLMPWDLMPEIADRDMAICVQFVRPTSQPGGERVPYERTGVHPAEDDPESHNGRLRREVTDASPWTFRTDPTGASVYLPHNRREPLEGPAHG